MIRKGSLYLKVINTDAEQDINAEKDSLANIESDYEFDVNWVDFYDCLNLVEVFSEVITIGTHQGKMYVYTEYDNNGFEQEKIVETPTKMVDIDIDVSVNYAVEYIKKFINTEIGNSMVKFRFSAEHALIVDIPLESDSFIRSFLAPRIDEDTNNEERLNGMPSYEVIYYGSQSEKVKEMASQYVNEALATFELFAETPQDMLGEDETEYSVVFRYNHQL